MAARKYKRDYTAIADAFQLDILEGRHPCGLLFRAAVERQVADLAGLPFKGQPAPTGYRFDGHRANLVCDFVEQLTHPIGTLTGEPIELRPWQVWALRCIYGWVSASTGYPRFRQVDWQLTKSHGKTLLCACLGLYEVALSTTNALVLSAGVTADQAGECFRFARTMVQADQELANHFGLVPSKYIIEGRGDQRAFKAVASESRPLAGRIPALIIIDELAQHPNRSVYDTLLPALVKRPDSRIFCLSNATFDQAPGAIGWERHCYAEAILTGEHNDPSTFVLLMEADRVDANGKPTDPWSEATWRQCNFNIGCGVDLPQLVNEARAAKRLPHLRATFEVMHLGWAAAGARAFIDPARWRKLGTAPSIEDTIADPDWANAKWWLGLDPAFGGRTGTDICALVVLSARLNEQGDREYRAWTRHQWLNELSATLETTPSLRDWADEGWLTVVPGETISMRQVVAAVKEQSAALPAVEALVIDKAWAASVVEELSDAGITVVPIDQWPSNLNIATCKLDEAITTGRLQHDGSPLTEWQAGNVEVRPNIKGEIKPFKKNKQESNKIDAICALVDCLTQAAIQPLDAPPERDAGGDVKPRPVVPRVIHLPSPIAQVRDDDSEDW